jgi:acetyl esterase/lipase
VSPLFGDVDELPPMMILAAEMDLLTPDTKRFVQKAQAAGKDVTVVEGPGMMHVWPLALPDHDGKKATDDMVDWMEEKKKKKSSSST